jgi:1,4-dihydroxy-2-naphthoate octaprenyltransferase
MTFRQFSGIVELRTKIVSMGTFALGLLYAAWRHGAISPLKAALVGAAALAVDMGTTGFNSYFDWYRNVDDPRYNREDAKVIIHEGVSPGAALAVSAACYAVAMILGLVLAFVSGPAIVALGAASLFVGFFYSAGPRPISSTPLGELFAGGFLGPVFFVVTVFAVSGRLEARDLLAALPQGLVIAAILSVNNACDLEGDRAAGRRTIAVLLGPRCAAWPIYAELIGAVGAWVWLSVAGVLPSAAWAFGVAAAALATPKVMTIHRRGYSHETKGANMGAISAVFLIACAGQAMGLVR